MALYLWRYAMATSTTERPELDDEFIAELIRLDRSDDWKRFAIVGRMMAALVAELGDSRGVPDGLHVHPAEDQRAWLWGYHWKPGGPLPIKRPAGECPECWRLGEACNEHYPNRWLT